MEALLELFNTIYPLSDNLIAYLTKNIKTKNLGKNEFLLQKGQINKEIYFIKKGLLRGFYLVDNEEMSSRFIREDELIVNAESFFDQTESNESIQALEDCTLFYINYDELQFIFRNFEEFNFVARVIIERNYILNEERLYAMRMQNATDRYACLMMYNQELVKRVPSKFLASYLDITEDTLNNIRGNL